jgi:drug/metabolite transporter (DMT)-like permease
MVAALVLGVGLMSVFNATAAIWAALMAWLWLGERLDRSRAMGGAGDRRGSVCWAWSGARPT